MYNPLVSASIFLINTVFSLFIFVLLIRLALALVRANYFDPITQFVIKASDWLIKPTRKLLPNIGALETASLTWILVLELVKLSLIYTLTRGMPHLIGILVLALGETLNLIIQLYLFAIIAQCLLSWLQPRSSVNYLLERLVSPVMQPIRQVVPMIGGIDISPIPAIIFLQLLGILLVSPILSMGAQLS